MTALKLVEQMSFNYDLVAAPIAIQAREAAERIKLRMRRTAEDIVEIGRDLTTTKASIGHGNFLPWIQAEFGMHERTAQRFMQVAEALKGKYDTVSYLEPTALYALANPKTPIEVREEIEAMIEAGEVVTAATVKDLRDKLSGLEKAKAFAEEEIEQKTSKVAELETSMNVAVSTEIEKAAKRIAAGYAEEVSRLKFEIAELKKPKPVTTIDNDTGTVVAFGKPLSAEEAAAIDADGDDYAEADFNTIASEQDRAIAFFGCIRSIARMSASPQAVYAHIAKGRSEKMVAEYMAMVDQAFSQLKAIKDQHNG